MRFTVLIAALLVFAACAREPADNWNRPGDSGAGYSRDAAACRSDANRRAEREYRLDTQHLDRRDSGGFGRQSIETDIARRDAERFRKSLYEECLGDQGYQRQQSGPQPSYPLEAR